MKRLKFVILLAIGVMPGSAAKNALLNILGNRISAGAYVGMSVLWRVEKIELCPGTKIGSFNIFRNIKLVSLGKNSTVGSWNWISAAPAFAHTVSDAGILSIGKESALTSRHYIDCSGGIKIGAYATVGGHRSTILTHGIDFELNRQTADSVRIEDWTFVSTGCTLLKGSVLPDRSVLAAGAVLTESRTEPAPGLWGGVPARRIADVSGAYFTRTTGYVN